MPIPSCGQGDTSYLIATEIPKHSLEKPVQVLQTITASIGKPSWRDDTICSGLMSGIVHGQADRRRPWSWWKKLMGKAPILDEGAGGPHPLKGQSWGDKTWHPALRDICGCNQLDGTQICKPHVHPRIPFVQCNLPSVWVEGGYCAPFMSWFMTCLLVCLTHTANVVIKPC